MLQSRLLGLVPLVLAGALSILVLEAFDVQDPTTAALCYVAISLLALATLRWTPRHHAVVLRRAGGTVRIVQRWGPYVTLPGYERLRHTVDLRALVAAEAQEPLVVAGGKVALADLSVRVRVTDVALAVEAMPKRERLTSQELPAWMRTDPPFDPRHAVLDAARAYLRPAVASLELTALRERTPQLQDGLQRALDARANQWGLAVDEATVRFPNA